jgi:hypothetical protein
MLKTISVGTGRDGTMSLNHMIERVFASCGGGRTMHEYCCRESYQAFCDYRETGAAACWTNLQRMVSECPYDAIVGNGHAAILPLFAERYGRGLKLVHLRRADRAACIASLAKNCALFPTAYGYYSSSPEATVKRMAAFHFGEMTRWQWDRLSTEDKFGWYYDKTHALIAGAKALFDDYTEIETEMLDSAATRRVIADLVGGPGAAVPPKSHLNAAMIDISAFPKEHQFKMNWLLGRLNIDEMVQDDVYAIDYFLEKFTAWTGYQITKAPQLGPAAAASADEIAIDLDRVLKIVSKRRKEFRSLRRDLRRRGAARGVGLGRFSRRRSLYPDFTLSVISVLRNSLIAFATKRRFSKARAKRRSRRESVLK